MPRLVPVILKRSVNHVGVAGSVVEVKPGFAFNYLIKKGLAVFATDSEREDLKSREDELRDQHTRDLQRATEIAKQIDGKPVVLVRPINDTGILYGAISQQDVSDELNKEFGQSMQRTFNPQDVSIPVRIRSYGVYKANVNLYYGVSTSVVLLVERNTEEATSLLEVKEEPDLSLLSNLAPGSQHPALPSGDEDISTADGVENSAPDSASPVGLSVDTGSSESATAD